jgi:GNAT superfamily N-acetyltransferase
MRSGEAEAVLELWLGLVDHHRDLDPAYPGSRSLRPALHGELMRALREPRCRLFVAEVAGRVGGFVLAQLDPEGEDGRAPGGCWIHELYVEPELRGKGVGSELVARAEAFFAEQGVSRVAVRVEALNRGGLRFWARRGFAERARILERTL